MCLSFTPAVPLSQNLLYQARVFNVGLGERKQTKKKTFYTLHSHKTSHLGEHSISTPTSSFFPLLNQPGIGETESSRVCFCYCLFNFFPHYYYEIFIPSSSWWPYQYITVVFRNSLPSATEDTHKPRISQELTCCCCC